MAEGSGWPGELTPADVDGRMAKSWPATGPAFRRHLTRHWAWNHRFALHAAAREQLEVADGLADSGPGRCHR